MKSLPTPESDLLRQAFRIIELEDKNNVKRNQDISMGAGRLILTSPNGTNYQVIVTNLGVLMAVPL